MWPPMEKHIMAKYQGAYRNELNNNEEEVLEQSQQEMSEAPQGEEDSSFKKRYGDLRRHMQQSMQQKDREMHELKEQLEQATRKQLKFPKTEDEVNEWVKKYPDVAAIIDTIAQKRAMEALQVGEQKMTKLKDLEKRLEREKAEQELLKMHPDFLEIRSDKAFHNWVSEQPTWVQDALYKNETDARAAGRAIDLYKADTGAGKRKRSASNDAAKAVGRTTSSSAPTGGKVRFTESQIGKMSPREYEANEAAIMEAMRTGNFEYDLSGGAR